MGDCFEFLKNNTLSRAGLNGENGTARNVHYGDILIKFGDCLDGERSDLPFITDDTVLPKFTGSILREGDVIFADTAEDEAAGKCVELRKLPKEPTISGLHTIPARPRFPFGTGYLGHYLNSDAYHRQLLPLMQGIKVISVSKASLQDTQVRFPGLSEQTAIGAALSEIDALITLHQRKRKYRGLYGYLSWEQRKLGEVASEFQSGEFISATEITENGDYPVYGGNGLRGYANRYNHEGFYALIGRQGALCGNVNCADGKAYFTEHAVAVQANQCNDTGFLVYLLSRMNLGQYSGQSAQPGLAVSTLKEVETLLPSKYEQYRIGSLLKDLDSLITLHQ